MLPFRCSRLKDSISNDSSWPFSTIPTRLSSAWVTLISMIFGIWCSAPPRRPGFKSYHAATARGQELVGWTAGPYPRLRERAAAINAVRHLLVLVRDDARRTMRRRWQRPHGQVQGKKEGREPRPAVAPHSSFPR